MTTATQEANGTRTVYDVHGMDCAECARSVATAVERLPGVTAANVNFGAGTLTVDADEHSTVDLTPRVLHAVEVAGYRAVSRDSEARIESGALLQERRAQLAVSAVGLWLVGAVVSVMLERYDLARFIYAAAVVAGAWTFGRAAWMALRHRRIDMNVLMSVAIVGAILLGDWAEAAAAAALFAIGNLAQSLTLDRTRNALSSLSKLSPSEAWRVRDGREELVAVEQLVPGDSIRVRPGERFPIDGMFIEGSTAVDESLITGESMPVGKQPGSAVFAGSLNGSGSVLIEATHTVAESTLAQMAELVDQARGGRGQTEQTIDRFAAIYTPAVVVLAALLALAGGAMTGDWRDWATRGLVLVVIACPCALIISTPVAIVSAVGVAARRGFLVKGGTALETIASIKTIALDKTGTLTRGRPVVTQVMSAGGDANALLRQAAAVENLSEHPLALAVIDHAVRQQIEIPAAAGFEAVTSRGARATVGSRTVWVGSSTWFSELGIFVPAMRAEAASGGGTVLLVADDADGAPQYRGWIGVADDVRPESSAVVQLLHELGIHPIVMMTGDNRAAAEAVATGTGVDEVLAELLPAEKLARIAELEDRYGPVAMVGDGVNDGPALGRATAGFAMGLTGSDLAVDTADVAILRNDLFAIPGAIDLARKTVAIIRQNIAISLVVKVVALLLTLFGVTTLWMAVAFDLGTSLLVTANALRLTRWQLEGSGHRHASEDHAAGGVPSAETGLAGGDA